MARRTWRWRLLMAAACAPACARRRHIVAMATCKPPSKIATEASAAARPARQVWCNESRRRVAANAARGAKLRDARDARDLLAGRRGRFELRVAESNAHALDVVEQARERARRISIAEGAQLPQIRH